MNNRIVSLDALRGIAALAVVLFHADPLLGNIAPGGYLAVDLFFALSAFVLAHRYGNDLEKGLTPWKFFLKRLKRFYPLYLAGIVLGIVLMGLLVLSGSPSAMSPTDIVLATTLGILFLPLLTGGDIFPLNVPSWSLFYELVVNVLFAATYKWLSGVTLYLVALAALAGFIAGGNTDAGPLADDVLPALMRTIFSFTLGLIIYRWRRPFDISSLPMLAIVTFLLLAPVPKEWRSLYDLGCVCVVFPLSIWVLAGIDKSPFENISIWLGEISFAIYAIHWPLVWIFNGIGNFFSAPKPVVSGIFLLAVLIGSHILHRYYDTPLRRRLSNRPALA